MTWHATCNIRLYVKKKKTLYPRHNATTILIMLLWCSDIELNPGPTNQERVYSCGTCQLAVNWSQKAVNCDTCDVWYHKTCATILSVQYTGLHSSDTSWYCHKCDSHCIDIFSYQPYEVAVHNSYELLSHIPGDNSFFMSLKCFQPDCHSSPLNTKQVSYGSQHSQPCSIHNCHFW